ncbi:MAG: DUF5074 domain-containing protein [Marinifilaceae bacterium]
MKTTRLLMAFLMISVALFSSSCSSDDDNNSNSDFNPLHLHGAFVTCEGNFNSNNGSVSFLNSETGVLQNGLYENKNSKALGDIVQSFAVAGDNGYIVVNNSQKVEVVDMETFENRGTITGVNYPRYFLQVNNSVGYLTNGANAGKVYVIDLAKNVKIDSVEVGNGPEDLKISGDFVYVANSGGWGTDHTVSVIDPVKHEVYATISVGDSPVALQVDQNGDVWVLCKGLGSWNGGPTNAKLIKIDRSTMKVVKTFDFGGALTSFGTRLIAMDPEGKNIYFENGGIFKMSIEASELPTQAFVTAPNGSFYGIAVDPKKGDIYGFEQDWNGGRGKMFQYNSQGKELNTFEVGIGPNGIVFY